MFALPPSQREVAALMGSRRECATPRSRGVEVSEKSLLPGEKVAARQG